MDKWEQVKQNITDELKIWDQPSISVVVMKDGQKVLSQGFGYADVKAKRVPDEDTLYQIGSCSKAFTAAACALLVDKGLLEWDKPVRNYLPWLKFMDPFTSDHVTVRDLLCHRTGLPRHDALWINGSISRRGMVENLANSRPAWSFRSHWCYQNACFVAAGVLVEELSGMTWEEFVKKEILEPLGMDRTTFYVDAIANDPNNAVPYERVMPTDLNGYQVCDYLKSDLEDMEKGIGAPYGPAGSIMSTIKDMAVWVQFNLDNGKYNGKQIISEENMKELHKPQMLLSAPLLVPLPEEDFYSYGMGWFIEIYRGHKMVEHGGNINGFSALVTMVPDLNLGIVTLTNFNDSFDTYATTNEIIDTVLGVEGGDWNNRYRKFISDVFGSLPEQMKAMNGEPVQGTTPSRPLADFAGTYHNKCYGDVVITEKDGGLEILYNKSASALEHFHYDCFRIADPRALLSGMVLQFVTDKKGKVASLKLPIQMEPSLSDEVFAKKED